jgi:hypothetical protein
MGQVGISMGSWITLAFFCPGRLGLGTPQYIQSRENRNFVRKSEAHARLTKDNNVGFDARNPQTALLE